MHYFSTFVTERMDLFVISVILFLHIKCEMVGVGLLPQKTKKQYDLIFQEKALFLKRKSHIRTEVTF